MPKLYDYLGIVVLFYSNEHEPIHVHDKCQGRESRAELVIRDGRVEDITYSPIRGRRPLEGVQLQDFKTVVSHHADDIVRKWIDYFVLHRRVEPEIITPENQVMLPEDAVIFVERAEQVGEHRIRLTFSDAAQRIVDFGPFLSQSRNPFIQTYLDPAAFARFTVRDGDLVWDDYELCFPIADLYEGRV